MIKGLPPTVVSAVIVPESISAILPEVVEVVGVSPPSKYTCDVNENVILPPPPLCVEATVTVIVVGPGTVGRVVGVMLNVVPFVTPKFEPAVRPPVV
jgi:hypothetical protein